MKNKWQTCKFLSSQKLKEGIGEDQRLQPFCKPFQIPTESLTWDKGHSKGIKRIVYRLKGKLMTEQEEHKYISSTLKECKGQMQTKPMTNLGQKMTCEGQPPFILLEKMIGKIVLVPKSKICNYFEIYFSKPDYWI